MTATSKQARETVQPNMGAVLPTVRAFSMSPEQRQAALEKARIAKAEKQAYAKANLRRDFLDSSTWDDLAKQAGIRLPSWSAVPTPGQMSVWLKKVGISVTRYLEWSGEKSLKDFRKANPSWPLRAWVGIVMELKANA